MGWGVGIGGLKGKYMKKSVFKASGTQGNSSLFSVL